MGSDQLVLKTKEWFMRTGPGTKHAEMLRTAEMMVDLAERQGVFHAFDIWVSTNRTSPEDIRQFTEILQSTRGAIR